MRGTTDAAVLKELGDRLARRRLRENLTQAKLAHEAAIELDLGRRAAGHRAPIGIWTPAE